MVFGHGVCSLVQGAVAVVVASGCCTLQGLSSLRGLLLLGTSLLGDWGFLELYFGPDYIQFTAIGVGQAIVAAGFTADAWIVVTKVVAIVGVGLMGKVGFMGKECSINLTLNLLFTGDLAFSFFSAFLGTGFFCGKEFL